MGKGIYFASENGKSASYVSCTGNNIGIMFLNEVALGKEHHITKDDSSLKTGFFFLNIKPSLNVWSDSASDSI